MLLRAEYRLGPELRFLSNLDAMHLIERALRRADLPYALSAGFNPHIRLSMGTVLPVGLWGEREYFDLELNEAMNLNDFTTRLNAGLPPAVQLHRAVNLSRQAPALMRSINAASYGLVLDTPLIQLESMILEIMARDTLWVKSRGKKKNLDKDLRSGMYKIDLQELEKGILMTVWVAVGEPLNVRYDELLDALKALGLDKNDPVDIYRQGNYIYRDGMFISPMEKVD